MEPTRGQAAQLLATADVLRSQVNHSAARPSRALIGWGAFVLVMLPPFDVTDHDIWGPILTTVAICGWLLTRRYYHRAGRVRLEEPGRSWLVWLGWAGLYGALVLTAELLQTQVAFIWSAAAVTAALPLLIIGARLSRQGR